MHIHNIVFKSSATRNGASVFAFTSSTVTPSATSMSVNPSVKSTSKTANSVMIRETHRCPVSGKVHSDDSLTASNLADWGLTFENLGVSLFVDMVLHFVGTFRDISPD